MAFWRILIFWSTMEKTIGEEVVGARVSEPEKSVINCILCATQTNPAQPKDHKYCHCRNHEEYPPPPPPHRIPIGLATMPRGEQETWLLVVDREKCRNYYNKFVRSANGLLLIIIIILFHFPIGATTRGRVFCELPSLSSIGNPFNLLQTSKEWN